MGKAISVRFGEEELAALEAAVRDQETDLSKLIKRYTLEGLARDRAEAIDQAVLPLYEAMLQKVLDEKLTALFGEYSATWLQYANRQLRFERTLHEKLADLLILHGNKPLDAIMEAVVLLRDFMNNHEDAGTEFVKEAREQAKLEARALREAVIALLAGEAAVLEVPLPEVEEEEAS